MPCFSSSAAAALEGSAENEHEPHLDDVEEEVDANDGSESAKDTPPCD